MYTTTILSRRFAIWLFYIKIQNQIINLLILFICLFTYIFIYLPFLQHEPKYGSAQPQTENKI